ncbi:MAG: hypothetical protein AMS15_03235 [Planctomycetes bacterium DG_23]|nr:MAG: hypothetical protein AMS15_03235 [Planctomycetes bacterium DG_23]
MTEEGVSPVSIEIGERLAHFDGEVKRYHRRNFIVSVVHFIVIRLGWIFKTESVIIPGFVGNLARIACPQMEGLVLSLIPVISRLGQSVPQLVVAQRVEHLKRHSRPFMLSVALFTLPWGFFFLVLLLAPGIKALFLLIVFFFSYAIFWLASGASRTLFGVVQGKLIAPESRGSLFAWSQTVGCFIAAPAALFMREFMEEGRLAFPTNYAVTFGLSFIFFGLCLGVLFFLKEPAYPKPSRRTSLGHFLSRTLQIFRQDRNFRRLAIAGALTSVTLLLFPYYIKLARDFLGINEGMFAYFVIAQNLANGTNSWIMGRMADRKGNKKPLCILSTMAAVIPLLALLLVHLPGTGAPWAYTLVFLIIGILPATVRMRTNYALELAPIDQHPIYVAALNSTQVLAVALSPIIGLAIDAFSFTPVFLIVAGIAAVGAVLTFTLIEPRHS